MPFKSYGGKSTDSSMIRILAQMATLGLLRHHLLPNYYIIIIIIPRVKIHHLLCKEAIKRFPNGRSAFVALLMALHRYIPLISIHSAIHKPPQIVHIMICVVKASSRLDIHSIRHTNRHSLQMIDIVSMIHTSQIMPPPPHGIQHNCVDLFATFRAVDFGDGVIEIHLLFAYALQQPPTMNASLVDAMCCHLLRPHLPAGKPSHSSP
eukprot:396242_1